jgi:plasmid maintenance system antidote protein VapI
VPATRISAIVNETRGIAADTALRLGRYCSTTSEILDESAARL